MKSLVAGLFLSFTALVSQAQSNVWNLESVNTDNNELAGYIYHIYAKGTTEVSGTVNNHVAGLRFVCSVRKTDNMKSMIAIYWDGPHFLNAPEEMTVMVDLTIVPTKNWAHIGPLIYIPVSEASVLIPLMKRGRTIMFTWVGEHSTKYAVGFDLKDFNLSKFNSYCKTNL